MAKKTKAEKKAKKQLKKSKRLLKELKKHNSLLLAQLKATTTAPSEASPVSTEEAASPKRRGRKLDTASITPKRSGRKPAAKASPEATESDAPEATESDAPETMEAAAATPENAPTPKTRGRKPAAGAKRRDRKSAAAKTKNVDGSAPQSRGRKPKDGQPSNIRRVESKKPDGSPSSTRGWQFHHRLNGAGKTKLFSDGKFGGTEEALKAAIEYRDEYFATLEK